MKALIALSIGCSLAACAGTPPPRIDSACATIHPTHASPHLKKWLRRQLARPGAPKDLPQFVQDVAANNEILRKDCPP